MANKKNIEETETVEVVEEVEVEVTEFEKELERKLGDDEILADMPALKPAEKLRIRERNRLLRLVMLADDASSNENATERETQLAALELMAGIDEFAESIALNPDAYVAWAEGQGHETFIAILNRYATALGK